MDSFVATSDAIVILTRLTFPNLESCKIDDASLEHLAGLKRLKKLILNSSEVRDESHA